MPHNHDSNKPIQPGPQTSGVFDKIIIPPTIFKQAEEIAKLGIWRIEFSDSGSLIIDSIQWSPGVYRIFEIEPYSVKLTINLIASYIPDDDLPKVKLAYFDGISNKAPISIEHKLVLHNGKAITVLTCAEITFSSEGAPEYITGTIQDITDRKHYENALIENERRMNRSEEIAHLGSWELDLENDKLTWSDEVYRIFGLAPREFKATYEAFLEHVHPDDRDAVNQAFISSVNDGRNSYDIVHRVVVKSTGEVRVVHEKCEHFLNEKGHIVRSVGMVHDITERYRAEEALSRANKSSFDIINRISDAFFGVDKNWCFVYLNSVAKHMGFREHLIGKNVWQEVPQFVDTIIEEKLKESMALQESKQFEWNDPVSGRWFNVSAYPSEEGLTVYAQDVTHQLDAKYKLKKLLAEKEILLKEVHHRVKNNLQTINSLLNLQAAAINDDNVKRVFTESQNRIKTMSLIHQELYAGNIDRVNTVKYLTNLLSYLLNTYSFSYSKIEVLHSIDEALLDIDTSIPLGLLFNEILSNIFKHAFTGRDKGKINIEFTRQPGGFYRLLVSDDGVGFAPGFAYEHSNTLGIQLIYSLTSQLEGKISINNSGGTEFVIDFPEQISH